MKLRPPFAYAFCLALLVSPTVATAETITFSAPGLDRWNYPFAGNGSEIEAPIFSALGEEGLDERDGQFIVAYDSVNGGSGSIPAGLGAANYQVTSVKLIATASSVLGAPVYDGTYDSVATYLKDTAAGYVADSDAGRPIELFGAGFIAGYSSFAFGVTTDSAPPAYEENNPRGFGPPTGRYVRPISFDASGDPISVANSVDYLNDGAAGFESNPFAVGVSTLAPGANLVAGTELTFDVDLSNPAILEYVQSGLDKGQLGFVFSTLGLSDNYARLLTKEFTGGNPVRLELEVTAVPEPSSLSLLAVSFVALGGVVWSQLRRRPA
jgi:hypothetical protein